MARMMERVGNAVQVVKVDDAGTGTWKRKRTRR